MTKPMTAEQYRQHAAQAKKEQPTVIKTLPSGSVFELRRPNLQVWVMTGRVPQSLLDAGVKAWKEQGKFPEKGKQQIQTPQSIADSGIFFLKLVQECTVNPRLVEFPSSDGNEIGPDTMLDEDFFWIVNWAMNHEGVAGIDGLQSFREGRERGTSSNSPDGAELRPEVVEPAAN